MLCTCLAAPFDNDLNLFRVAFLIKAWLQLNFGAVDLGFLLENLLEALKLLHIAVFHLKRSVCSFINVVDLRWLAKNDLVAAVLEESNERLAPGTLESKFELHLGSAIGVSEYGHDTVHTPRLVVFGMDHRCASCAQGRFPMDSRHQLSTCCKYERLRLTETVWDLKEAERYRTWRV